MVFCSFVKYLTGGAGLRSAKDARGRVLADKTPCNTWVPISDAVATSCDSCALESDSGEAAALISAFCHLCVPVTVAIGSLDTVLARRKFRVLEQAADGDVISFPISAESLRIFVAP